MRRRARLSLLLALLMTAPLAAAQAHYISLRGKLVHEGVLSVGIALTGRPFAYRQDGELRGFEIDWAAQIAHSRGLELRPVQLPRTRLIEALRGREVDLVNTSLLEGEPPAGIATLPYLVLGDHIMVLKGNPFRIRGPADLAGHIVSTTAGTSGEAFAREINERLIAENRAPMYIHSFPHQRDTHVPVSMGHGAAYFTGTRSAVLPTLDPASRVKLLPGAFKPRREAGFAVLGDNPELREAVERAMAAKVANGAYDRLRVRHGLPDDVSPFR